MHIDIRRNDGTTDEARVARVQVGWCEMQPVVIYADTDDNENTLTLDEAVFTITDDTRVKMLGYLQGLLDKAKASHADGKEYDAQYYINRFNNCKLMYQHVTRELITFRNWHIVKTGEVK